MHRNLRIWLIVVALIVAALPNPVTAQDDKTPPITPSNAAQLELLERLGRGALTGPLTPGPTANTLIIPTTLGFYIWDYTQTASEPRLVATDEPMYGALPSPDGQYIAARAYNGEVSVWDMTTGAITFTRGLPPPQAIGAGGMAWSANSQALAVGTWDDTVSVFDPRTGDPLAFYASGIGIEVQGYVDPAELTSLSPDGTRMVWGSMGARLELRNVGGEQDIHVTLTRRDDEIHAMRVDWSADSRYLAISLSDSSIRVYEAATGKLIKTLDGYPGSVLGSAWQPRTNILQYSTGVHWWRWDAQTDETVGHITAPDGVYRWSPDGSHIALAGDAGLHILDAATGEIAQELSSEPVTNPIVEWSPDGSYLLMQDDRLTRHWKVETGQLVGGTNINGSTWLAGGELLAFFAPDTRVVWVINTADGSPVATLPDFSAPADRLYWGANGLQIAHSSFYALTTTITNAQGKVIHQMARADEISQYGFIETYSVVWSTDGTRFATISPNGGAKIWTLDKAWPAVPMVLDAPDPNALVFSPDDRLMITTGWDDVARVYDGKTHQPITTLTGFDEPTNAAAFSPDGLLVAVGSYDRTVQVFRVGTWEHVVSLTDYNYTYAKPNIAFAPDGTTLAYPNRQSGLTLWNVASGDIIEMATDGFGGGESLAWSPDSQVVAVGMYSGEIVLWDVPQAQWLVTLNAKADSRDFSRPVNTLLFSPDGTQLIVAGDDSTIQIWGVRAD